MFSCNMNQVPRIHDWHNAKRVFDNAKPWRSNSRATTYIKGAEGRPLAERRAYHKAILAYPDGRYACRLYNTDMLTFWPDGTIEVRTHNSNMSVEFFSACAPYTLIAASHQSVMYVGAYTATGVQWYREGKGPLRFRADPERSGKVQLLNPEAAGRDSYRTLDKGATALIRDRIKPFENWVRATAALSNGACLRRDYNTPHMQVDSLLDKPDDLENYPKYLQYVIMHNAGQDTLTAVINKLRELCYRKERAFVENEVPLGGLPPKSKRG